MKKYTILGIFSFLLISWCDAQITITTADIATPGKVTYQANDTMPVISVGPAGANQTWNFTGLLNAHTIDTLLFISPADAGNYMDFPTTNLVIPMSAQGDYLYTVNSPSDLSAVATTENRILFPGADKSTIVYAYTPSEKLIQFPSTYNTSFTQSYKGFAQYFFGSVPNMTTSPYHNKGCGLSDSLRERITFSKTVLVDAWGSISTLAGTFDAIRFKETKIMCDTMEGHDALLNAWFFHKVKADSTVTYFWYANNVGVPLVTATMDSTGAVKNVTWLAAALGTAGINELSSSSNVNTFPDPAQNEITFAVDASKIHLISVYDITGRFIDSFVTSSDRMTVNTSNYPNGIYTYSLIDKKNNILNRGKFSVVK
ncbi:MAG: T9SS type A sorting domain-containing protein [Bacteroidia bacterium]